VCKFRIILFNPLLPTSQAYFPDAEVLSLLVLHPTNTLFAVLEEMEQEVGANKLQVGLQYNTLLVSTTASLITLHRLPHRL